MQRHRFRYLGVALTALLIIAIGAGCTYNGQAENKTSVFSVNDTIEPEIVQNISETNEYFNPADTLRIGERFRYNDTTGIHKPSGAGDTISIWVDSSSISKSYYIKPRYLGAELTYCPPNEGEKYLFIRIKSVALKKSAYTPYIDSFSLIDDDGRIYSPSSCFCNGALCLSGGEAGFSRDIEIANLYTIQDIGGIYTSSLIDRSEVQAMIMFIVPDSFSKSSSYLMLDTGGAEAVWSLSDVYADITVRKSEGRIYIYVQNARNLHLVRDITISLVYPGNSTSEINTDIPGIGETGIIEVQNPGFEKVTITANLYSGEKVLVYNEK